LKKRTKKPLSLAAALWGLRHRRLLAVCVAGTLTNVTTAPQISPPDTPEALGFAHFFKCPSDADVDILGDTITAKACLAACQTHSHAAGCWWLDGTGGFRRECRLCRTQPPTKMQWQNDWALPLSPYTS
jgi:hypothetical protein